MLTCGVCGGRLNRQNKSGYCERTPACRRTKRRASVTYRREYYASHREVLLERGRLRNSSLRGKAARLLSGARRRAKRGGLPFDLTAEWVERELASAIGRGCPLLGIDLRLDAGRVTAGSPTIDRFDPGRGYTQDNCWVVSHRANSMKQDATLNFMRRILEYADTRFAVGSAV